MKLILTLKTFHLKPNFAMTYIVAPDPTKIFSFSWNMLRSVKISKEQKLL